MNYMQAYKLLKGFCALLVDGLAGNANDMLEVRGGRDELVHVEVGGDTLEGSSRVSRRHVVKLFGTCCRII